jgi:hypothetical protein
LGRGELDIEVQRAKNLFLEFRRDVRVGANRTRNLASRDVLDRHVEPRAVPPKLVVPDRELQAERGWLGVHPVRSADGERAPVRDRLLPDRLDQIVETLSQQPAGISRLHRESGVYHIRRRQSQMDESGCIADSLTGRPKERDDIVVGLALDLLHPVEITRRLPDTLHGVRRDAAPARPRLADLLLDVQPPVDLRLLAPDRSHLWQRISLDHPLYSVLSGIAAGAARLSWSVYVHMRFT